MGRLAYRKDLDGLRALAVLLVIAYHFGIEPFSAGYIGVDLFFVISGFLIATWFDREAKVTLPVLAGFYRRRLLRLMPAFITVAVATSAVAWYLLLPEDLEAFTKSLRESALFRANVFFARATTGYFAANNAELPWLHVWSLSVEWQFYAAFPLAVVLLRLLPPCGTRWWASCAATLVGVAVSVTIVTDRPDTAYFSTVARFFEFLAGTLAASTRVPDVGRRTATTLSAFCVAALSSLSALLTRETPFPGLAAALVCGLTFVLVVVGREASVLAFDAAAAIGRRSYSAYLWHWPIAAFLAYVQYRLTMVDVAMALAAIAVLSELTYRLVERPGVAARWALPAAFTGLCVVPALVAAGAYRWVEREQGFVQRFGPAAEHAYANLRRFDPADADRCNGYRGSDFEPCVFGDRDSHVTALLIGDSHARHFKPFVQSVAEQARVKVYGLTDDLCLAIEGVTPPARFGTRAAACAEAIDRNDRLIRSRRFEFVLIAEWWIVYPADQLAKLDAMLTTIVGTGAIPVLFKPTAEDGTNPKDCFFRDIKLHRATTGRCAIAIDNGFATTEKRHVDALIDAMKVRHPLLRVIDPQSVQCEGERCTTVIDDTPIYSDTHHLNAFGATSLAVAYLSRFGNPLK